MYILEHLSRRLKIKICPLSVVVIVVVVVIFGWWVLKFVQMKGPSLFQGEIIMQKRKYIDEI